VKLRVATCRTLPEVDPDEEPLMRALAAARIDATLVAWDDPAADWDAPIPTVIRSTWNYALSLDAFLAWVARASAAAPVLNPADVISTNVRKRYLLELAARGVATVPTQLAAPGDAIAIDAARIVIKPEVGAGSLGTKLFARNDPAAAAHLHELTQTGLALVQPFVASVDDYGERSLIWIDGQITHAIRKSPRFAGDSERVDGPVPIAPLERRLAEAALAPYVDRILYGRVDLARDDAGQPMVMELELVEPSLFFARHPPALDRYVRALIRFAGYARR
jgi:glutathione synthase/RimK-type ligase-like ATP-grasp enzyme